MMLWFCYKIEAFIFGFGVIFASNCIISKRIAHLGEIDVFFLLFSHDFHRLIPLNIIGMVLILIRVEQCFKQTAHFPVDSVRVFVCFRRKGLPIVLSMVSDELRCVFEYVESRVLISMFDYDLREGVTKAELDLQLNC